MTAFNLTTQQSAELVELLATTLPTIADKISKGVTSTAALARSSTVTLAIKIAFDKERENLINVSVEEKIKHPRSVNADHTAWTDPLVLISYKTNEEAGQQRIVP